ncbi:Uncharacterised protein [Vibrio cholerae]|uniref:Uncharacterized protein n=1 Tax=Vibrio cholerae TaxID=666 RepID=A0A655SB49_VIBCL|nr:Uncharacterised protein [Vibrio cholerae]CSA38196.1 Uncharacterised protein [Vibrio cholerae]CSB19675.1 Uncharacterised protein [Vibrio cholerae]CSB80167.1 Uncharacterised protein [Vibrio cholerae]CSC14791.1 Uncharacterised protein [Vibrio cholerae]
MSKAHHKTTDRFIDFFGLAIHFGNINPDRLLIFELGQTAIEALPDFHHVDALSKRDPHVKRELTVKGDNVTWNFHVATFNFGHIA